MDWIVIIAILFAGGLHGFTFSLTLIRVFGLHRNNPLIPWQIDSEEKMSLLMGNTILITFIILALVAWTNYFSQAIRAYAGTGLIVFAVMFIATVFGKFMGSTREESQ